MAWYKAGVVKPTQSKTFVARSTALDVRLEVK